MPQSPELRGIVQRMLDAGESETNIGAVIQRLSPAPVSRQREMPDARSLVAQAGMPPVFDAGVGTVKGLARTAVGIGNIAVNNPVVGPWVDKAYGLAGVEMTPEMRRGSMEWIRSHLRPTNRAQGVGQFIEQGAEFAVPLARIARMTAGQPILRRMAAEGAASAGVAGLQTGGDAGAMTVGGVVGSAVPVVGKVAGVVGRAVQRGSAGAKEGGFGGGVASALRTVAPSSPEQMVIQAVKPRSSRLWFKKNLDTAMREVNESVSTLGTPITNADDTLAAIAHAKTRVRADYDAIAGPLRLIGSEVDLTPVATAMVKSIPTKLRLERPTAAKAIERLADRYRRKVPLADAERYLVETNAELESYYAKFPASRRATATANPETALATAQATTLRNQIYQTLEHPGQGQSARELNRRYGTLMELEGELTRRVIPAARLAPESLAEQISTAHAVGQIVRGGYQLSQGNVAGAANIASGLASRHAAKFMKEQQTTDALLRRAFAAYKQRPIPVAMPPAGPEIRGLLGPGARAMPPGADPSYVRGVPAQYGRVVPRLGPATGHPSNPVRDPRTMAIPMAGQTMRPGQEPFIGLPGELRVRGQGGQAPVQQPQPQPRVIQGEVVGPDYVDAIILPPPTPARLPRGQYDLGPSAAPLVVPPVVAAPVPASAKGALAQLREKQVSATEATRIADGAKASQGPMAAGEFYTMAPADISVDAARFQFKSGANPQGVTGTAKIDGPWNEARSGVLMVWKDPADGATYVINGHHRLEAAKRLGADRVAVRYLDAPDAKTARVEGALTNIAEDKGAPLDAAKLIRDAGFTRNDLLSAGLSSHSTLLRDGVGLATLSDPLFARVVAGEIPEALGAAIGAGRLSPEGQGAVWKLVERQQKKGRVLTPAQVRALVDDVSQTPEVTAGDQPDIFSLLGEERTQNVAVEKAVLRDWASQQLSQDKRLFGFVAKTGRADALARGGNVIDAPASRAIADEAGEVAHVFNRLAGSAGPISSALNAAATRIAEGVPTHEIRQTLLATLRAAVARELGAPVTGR